MGFSDSDKPSSFAEQYNIRRESHMSALQQKEEEMRQKFVIRVKEKESELKDAEREVSLPKNERKNITNVLLTLVIFFPPAPL